jgi:hypothetical protein
MVLGLTIFAIVATAFLALVAHYGYDSRDGRDWHGDPYSA